MKPIILSDQSTKLDNKNIFIVSNEKSSLGQIAYSLDLISKNLFKKKDLWKYVNMKMLL